ncbi:pectate lyase [Caulobacter ginsengisoli]|uniref:Pectate lyase n=1 Tax=Caulobacter ginsengisoli TaxID=400775 RepID=A0ABU0INY1_9CAUL|nr:pectate lyase [Caulobacter ginsengisoli]MDQ0463669.1 pectate lyase [Caulobacter ginsengisoli]
MFKRVFAGLSLTAMAAAGLLLTPLSGAAKPAAPAAPAPVLAFPGAQGWAAVTPGGRGGRIIKVTTLAGDGPGSLREAINASGPRIIVFEVGGVIDLDTKTLVVKESFVTIAGQTAPSPGITIIRGGMDVSAHDVVMQHIRIRSGEAGRPKKSGWEEDSFSTQGGAWNVIVDHCTLTWATDENMSASGPRFTGKTPDEWRAGASHAVTFSNNIVAEGLAWSTHFKIEHSKGSLIHDNTSDILIIGNLYAHNYERSPLFKGGVRGVIVNNLIYDPGQRALHYNLMAEEWAGHEYQLGQMVAVGNVLRAGPSTPDQLAFLEIGGYGDLEFYGRDNIAVDRIGRPLPMFGRYTTSPAKIIVVKKPPLWPLGLAPLAAVDVQQSVLAKAGARPWDRDYDDVRLIADVAEGRGQIIDSEDAIHGYPHPKPTSRPFNPDDWNLFDMTPRRPDVLDAGAKAKGT